MNRMVMASILMMAWGGLVARGQSAGKAGSKQTRQEENCGCESGVLPNDLAIVNGVRISAREIAEPIQDNIRELHRQVVELRSRELNIQINSRLVEAEAKKRGVTGTRLLEEEVVAKVQAPTEAEARFYYDQNKERIGREFADVKAALIDSLLNQRQKEEATRLVERLRAAAQVKVLVDKVTPPSSEAERARVMATVDGRPITSRDIEDALRPLIYRAQEQLYELRKRQLDAAINGVLLSQEAQKRSVTANSLLATEVTAKVKDVTEEDARAFYERNKEKIEGEYGKLKEQILQNVQDQEYRRVEEAYAQQLRRTAKLKIFLKAPESPVYAITTNDRPSRGRPDAPVTIVEFTDYQCPSCAKTRPVLDRLAQEYGDKVRIVVRNFPLQKHAHAFKAAEAAEAARAQGKYWEYARVLFAEQPELEVERLKDIATRLGLDRKEFDTALDRGKYSQQVERDLEEGRKLGINSTPTVFVAGSLVAEKTYDSLKAAIESALKEPATKTAGVQAHRGKEKE